jgi:hypothetical protein
MHLRYFTVYPDGWMPFGRKALVPLTSDGADIDFENNTDNAWMATQFQAVIDAARGKRWPLTAQMSLWPEGCELPVRTFRTQTRHIEGAMRFFRLEGSRELEWPSLIARLEIGLGTFVETSTKSRDGPLWRQRGEKGEEILRALGMPSRKVLKPLVEIGTFEGFWGLLRHLNTKLPAIIQ